MGGNRAAVCRKDGSREPGVEVPRHPCRAWERGKGRRHLTGYRSFAVCINYSEIINTGCIKQLYEHSRSCLLFLSRKRTLKVHGQDSPRSPSFFSAHSFHSGHRLAAKLQPSRLQWELEAGERQTSKKVNFHL